MSNYLEEFNKIKKQITFTTKEEKENNEFKDK